MGGRVLETKVIITPDITGGKKRNNFFPKFYFPLYRGLSPLTDIMTVCKGGYGGEGGYTPMPKGGMTGVCG
jgi:hypothetical protein